MAEARLYDPAKDFIDTQDFDREELERAARPDPSC